MADMAAQVWFYIIPTNELSETIVNDCRNQDYVVITDEAGATPRKVIQITFENHLKPNCILSFGRREDCNIHCDLPGTAFVRKMAQKQCSFLLSNGCLIFRDHSDRRTTTISPVHLNPPVNWHMDEIPRQRAIPEYGDWLITMGPATFLLPFRKDARWWERNLGEKDTIAIRRVPDAHALTDTPESSDILHQTRYETRVPEPHVPKDKQQLPAIVYHELEQIGKGSIGSVSRVMDLQSGRIIAVKIIPIEEGKEKDLKESARNEVETLAKKFHDHIVGFVHSL